MIIRNRRCWATVSDYFGLVEPAVIETASENPSSQLSTSVVYLLGFPRRNADKQAFRFGISLFMKRAGDLSSHVHC